jgi:hypothetical protein
MRLFKLKQNIPHILKRNINLLNIRIKRMLTMRQKKVITAEIYNGYTKAIKKGKRKFWTNLALLQNMTGLMQEEYCSTKPLLSLKLMS